VITSANYLENGSASNNYKVPSITYDKHGNIKSLERLGKTSSGSTFAAVDVLTTEHDGNQLKTVSEAETNVLISESYDFKKLQRFHCRISLQRKWGDDKRFKQRNNRN